MDGTHTEEESAQTVNSGEENSSAAAPAENRTRNLPITRPALYHLSQTVPTPRGVVGQNTCNIALPVLRTAVPAGSPSLRWGVAVYVFDINQPSLPTPFFFIFRSGVCFCLYGPFNFFFSFHKFSRQLSAFSLCFFGLISALLILSVIPLFMQVSLSPDIILCGWLGLKHQLTLISILSLSLSPPPPRRNEELNPKIFKQRAFVLRIEPATWCYKQKVAYRPNKTLFKPK